MDQNQTTPVTQNPEENQKQDTKDRQPQEAKVSSSQPQYVPVLAMPPMAPMMPQYGFIGPGGFIQPVQVVLAHPHTMMHQQMAATPGYPFPPQSQLPFLNTMAPNYPKQPPTEVEIDDTNNCLEKPQKSQQKRGKKVKKDTEIIPPKPQKSQSSLPPDTSKKDLSTDVIEEISNPQQQQIIDENDEIHQETHSNQQKSVEAMSYVNNDEQNEEIDEENEDEEESSVQYQQQQIEEEEDLREVLRYETLAITNKWVFKYLKNSKIRELFSVPVYEEEDELLQVLDIFAIKDKNMEEFEMPTYNPQKIKKPQDESQIGMDKYLNRNKSLLQYILNFFTVENLRELNMPENLLQAVYQAVNFIQRQCGYNEKKKSFRFNLMSHSHYRVLFLKINLRSIKELVKNQQDVQLHKECFNLDLPKVKQMYMDRNGGGNNNNNNTNSNDQEDEGGINSDQYLELKKDLQFVNFIKMCIHKLLELHIQDHILLDENNAIKYMNGEFEYEKRALNKLAQMIQGQYTNRF